MENSAFENVMVLGGGAIGSAISALLSHKKRIRLTMIGRETHCHAINTSGLKVQGESEKICHFSCQQRVTSPLDNTLVILTTKATDLPGALTQIAPHIQPSTLFLALQNGLGIREIILGHGSANITANRLYRGIVGFGATFLEPGTIRYWGGRLFVEERFRETRYHDIFSGTDIGYHLTANFKKRKWRKVIINSIYNPLSVLLKVDNKTISLEKLDPIKQGLLDEGQAVARSEGIDPEITLSQINRVVSSGNITSMLQDHLKGKDSEIDYINGAITRIGNKNRIPTPINNFITQLIKSIEYIRKNHAGNFSIPADE